MTRKKSETVSEKVEIDTAWFQRKIRDKDTSQRQIAFKMGLDPASMSLMLNGHRRMEVREAATLSVLISQPLDEVLARAGVQMPKRKQVPLIGVLNGDLQIVGDKGSAKFVPPPSIESAPNLVAIRVEDAGSPWFGWTYFYEPREGVDADAVGRFCVVRLPNKKTVVRYVRRGLNGGFTLFKTTDTVNEHQESKLISASPVLLIKP